jgi:hypothetical protein
LPNLLSCTQVHATTVKFNNCPGCGAASSPRDEIDHHLAAPLRINNGVAGLQASISSAVSSSTIVMSRDHVFQYHIIRRLAKQICTLEAIESSVQPNLCASKSSQSGVRVKNN